jgi:hypothetical protein
MRLIECAVGIGANVVGSVPKNSLILKVFIVQWGFCLDVLGRRLPLNTFAVRFSDGWSM